MRSGCTCLYLRFTLSYPDVQERLLNGFSTSPTRRRGDGFASSDRLSPATCADGPRPSGRHLDEMVVSIRGKRMYLWRTIDNEGEILEAITRGRSIRTSKSGWSMMC
jgi:transposase-like protein